jgi:predicted nucleic acid-binding protein
MGTLDLDSLPDGALLLVDSAPIIYVIEMHPKWRPRFRPIFEAHEAKRIRLAITTIALAEVLIGPFKSGDEALAHRYRSAFETWQRVDLDLDIAESAARLRASLGLKLPDAIQAASALKINAAGLVTHDRDFSRLRSLRVIS